MLVKILLEYLLFLLIIQNNLFNMRNETYDEDRRKFINMIESDKK